MSYAFIHLGLNDIIIFYQFCRSVSFFVCLPRSNIELSTIADTGNCVKGEFGFVTKALPFSGMDVTGQQCM